MRIDLPILARLAVNPQPSPSDLAKQLRRLVRPTATDADFRRELAPHLDRLAAGKWIQRKPLRVTESGRARVLEELGTKTVPPWREVRDRHLPGLALGRAPGIGVDDPRVAILARLLGRKPDRIEAMVDAVVADELGLDGEVTLSRIRAHLLARRLGLSTRSGEAPAMVDLVVASAIKAPRANIKTLRTTLAQRWLADEPPPGASKAAADTHGTAATKPPPVVAKNPPLIPPKAWTEDDLLAAVRVAVEQMPEDGRFGRDKVFVSAIGRRLEASGVFPGLTLDRLKTWLVTANRNRQLTLARADLVGAMDPREVAASEIRYLNATFHFVLDRSRP